MKSLLRYILFRFHALIAKIDFYIGRLQSGTHHFQRALDLNDAARLDLLESIGPRVDETKADGFRQSGEIKLMKGQDEAAGQDFAAAIVLSGSFREARALDRVIAPVVSSDNLIITQVAYNYYPIFDVWYGNMRKLGITNILLIALDPLTLARARAEGIACWYLPIFGFQKSVRRLIWTQTLKIRRDILNTGVNYLHSDADAIWLKDVRESVFRHQTDFVTSRARGTPPSAMEKWGFVMCLGFYYCRSNDKTRAFYDTYIEYSAQLGHDQNGLNQLFLDSAIDWHTLKDQSIHGNIPALDLTVTVIPETIVARPVDLLQPLITSVIHPVLSAPNIIGKMCLLQDFGVEMAPEGAFRFARRSDQSSYPKETNNR